MRNSQKTTLRVRIWSSLCDKFTESLCGLELRIWLSLCEKFKDAHFAGENMAEFV